MSHPTFSHISHFEFVGRWRREGAHAASVRAVDVSPISGGRSADDERYLVVTSGSDMRLTSWHLDARAAWAAVESAWCASYIYIYIYISLSLYIYIYIYIYVYMMAHAPRPTPCLMHMATAVLRLPLSAAGQATVDMSTSGWLMCGGEGMI